MASTKVVVVSAVAATLIAGATHAADMPPPFPMPPVVQAPPVVADYSSGWYLRGDIAYRLNGIDGATSAPAFADPISNEVADGFAFGGGLGYKAGWVRADVTIDYAPDFGYTGRIVIPGDVTAQISSFTGLFNLYFDLGTWSGFTPYLGAGIGAANVRTADYLSAVAPPFAPVGSNGRWNFAWAAMAGTSFAFSNSMLVDIGYRYLSLGDAVTASDAFGAMTFNSLTAHEFRVGMRWMFNDLLSFQ